MKLFKERYFYGCTALLACQFEGIISDIYKMQTDAGKIVSVEDFRMAYEYYNPDKKFSNSIRREREKINCWKWLVRRTMDFFIG